MPIIRLLAAFHLLVASTAATANWWWVQKTPQVRSMVQRSSVVREGVWATAWLHDFFLSPGDANQFSARYLVRHDCKSGQATVLSGQAYDGDGRLLSAPAPARPPIERRDLLALCDDDWSEAKLVQDAEHEVRMWRLLKDK